MRLGEPHHPRHSRQLPSAEQGKSPTQHLLHNLLLGCEGRRCSSGLVWVLALGNKAGGFGQEHQNCVLTRAGRLQKPHRSTAEQGRCCKHSHPAAPAWEQQLGPSTSLLCAGHWDFSQLTLPPPGCDKPAPSL